MRFNIGHLTIDKKISNAKGFTILEVLLSVSIIAVLTGLSIPVFNSLQIQNDLDVAAITIAENLRRAQVLSQAVEGDSSWGVSLSSGSIILFKGSTFDTRDTNYDESTSVSDVISSSGDTEIVFSKFYGNLSASKTINLQSANSTSKTLTLNEKGTIEY